MYYVLLLAPRNKEHLVEGAHEHHVSKLLATKSLHLGNDTESD